MNKPRNKIIYRLLVPVIIIVLLVFSLLTPFLINQIVSVLDDNTHNQVIHYGISALDRINDSVDDLSESLKHLIDMPFIEEALAHNNVAELTKFLLPVKINQEFDFTGAASHDKNLIVSFSSKDFPVDKIMGLDIIEKGISGARSSSLYLLNDQFYLIGVVSSSTRDNPNIIIAAKALDMISLKSLIGYEARYSVFLYSAKGEVVNAYAKDEGLADNIQPQIMERLTAENAYVVTGGLHNNLEYSNFYAPLIYNNTLQGFLEVHIPLDAALKAKKDIIYFTLIILFAGIFMILLTGYFSSRWISGRLNNMLKAIEQISSGNIDYRLTDTSLDEIGRLSSSFNTMVENLNASTEKLLKENRMRRDAESGLFESEERLRSIMDTANDVIISSDSRGNIIFANKATETILGYSFDEIMNKPVSLLVPKRYRDAHNNGLARVVKTGETRIIGKTIEMFALKKDGNEIPVELSLSMWEARNEIFFAAIIRDITKRIESENLLKKSEAKFKALFEHSPDSVIILRMFQDEFRIVDYNPLTIKTFRAGGDYLLNMQLAGMSPLMQHDKQFSKDKLMELAQSAMRGEPQRFEWRFKRFDNTYFDSEVMLNAILLDGDYYLNAIVRDITERRQTTLQLKMEKDRAQTYFNIAGVILLALDEKGNVSSINKKGCHTLGYKKDEIIGKQWFDNFIPERARRDMKAVFFKLIGGEVLNTEYYESEVLCKDGNMRIIAWHNTLLKNNEGVVTGTLSSGEDITERKKAEDTVAIQLNRLNALHSIDMAITSSFDLVLILNIFLDQVLAQLQANAASVFIKHKGSFILQHISSKGFTSNAGKKKILPGDSMANRAVTERKVILIPDIRDKEKHFSDVMLCEKEGFVSCVVVPLISKGDVKGVMEIFYRASFEPDDDWFEFVNALAVRAAIAIDDSVLFNKLQHSNIELSTAYDSAIEIWAKTLEIRDREPAGHSERVTDMALSIGKELGISDKELVNIRQGALLHDIGKLGIPDSILFKPGKLTSQEWDVIKSHPSMAYDLLYGIKPLRSALDIPFYHHERWDGTGYPKGLRGNEIPIGARIFAIVDVWDSLSSDRPYRDAWARDKILEHIRSESGRHFDPEVVEVFLRIV